MALNKRQRLFVAEYLIDYNATRAAIAAGYSPDTARSIASENLTKPYIVAAIQQEVDARLERARLTQDDIIRRLEDIFLFDSRKTVDDEDKPKRLSQLDDQTAAAVLGVELVEVYNESVLTGTVKKYKFADPLRSGELLMRHHGMFAPDRLTATVAAVTLTEDDRRAEALKLLEQGRLRAKP